jgi:hypothetical protein
LKRSLVAQQVVQNGPATAPKLAQTPSKCRLLRLVGFNQVFLYINEVFHGVVAA